MRTLNRLSLEREPAERASARRTPAEKFELARIRFLALPARMVSCTCMIFKVRCILLEMRLKEDTNRAIYKSI